MKVLDKSWENCIKMWEWVSKNLPYSFYDLPYHGRTKVVEELKDKWLKANGFTIPLDNDCFFCDYDTKHKMECVSCPAVLVDSSFHCRKGEYDCYYQPKRFYRQIVFLNCERGLDV